MRLNHAKTVAAVDAEDAAAATAAEEGEDAIEILPCRGSVLSAAWPGRQPGSRCLCPLGCAQCARPWPQRCLGEFRPPVKVRSREASLPVLHVLPTRQERCAESTANRHITPLRRT